MRFDSIRLALWIAATTSIIGFSEEAQCRSMDKGVATSQINHVVPPTDTGSIIPPALRGYRPVKKTQTGKKSNNKLNTELPPQNGEGDEQKPVVEECTTVSQLTNAFYDLRPIRRLRPEDEADISVRGWDYGRNFSLNICSPVLVPPPGYMGVPRDSNVSAFYTDPETGQSFSLGTVSTTPRFRGRKLVLEYTGGSPCPAEGSRLRKSALIMLSCDRNMMNKVAVSFVGQFNECDYFFEARTPYACPGSNRQQTVNPVVIFAIIFLIALVVYCAGGIFYQRTVMRARGLRQIPHYQTFRSIGYFIKYCLIRLTLCIPPLHRALVKKQHPSNGNLHGRSQYSDADSEDDATNTLIDQLESSEYGGPY